MEETLELPSLDLLRKIVEDDNYFRLFIMDPNKIEEINNKFSMEEMINSLRDYIRTTLLNEKNLSGKFYTNAKYLNDKFNMDIPYFRNIQNGIDEELYNFVMDGLEGKDKLEMARVIYLRLAKVLSYDEMAPAYNQNLNVPQMEEIYFKETNKVTLQDSKVMCSLWAYLYDAFLKKNKIDSKVVSKGKHKYVAFNINGEEITADVTNSFLDSEKVYANDLTRVKLNNKTLGFSKDTEDIDLKYGFKLCSLEESYKEFSNNHYALSNSRVTCGDFTIDLIRAKVDYINTICYNLPHMERVIYLRQMTRFTDSVFTEEEKSLVMPFLIRLKEGDTLKTSLVIAIKNGEEYIYRIIYNNELIEVNKEFIINLINEGILIDDHNIPGLNNLIR